MPIEKTPCNYHLKTPRTSCVKKRGAVSKPPPAYSCGMDATVLMFLCSFCARKNYMVKNPQGSGFLTTPLTPQPANGLRLSPIHAAKAANSTSRLDFLGNSVSYLGSLCICSRFVSKRCAKCSFALEVPRKLKFPGNFINYNKIPTPYSPLPISSASPRLPEMTAKSF